MRNRAKCKLCSDILESFHRHDYVTCKCGEIAIDGGNDYLKCSARDWVNLLRIDDEGNEIVPKVSDDLKTKENALPEERAKPNKEELMRMLDAMLETVDNLPQNAMTLPVTHYDFYSALSLLSLIFKAS